jgi:proteasome lid subunit RPN8/RPN11
VSEETAIVSTSFRLQLPRRLYEEMLAQAVAELPNECCGLFAGAPDGRVTQRYPLVNVSKNPTREYWSDEKSMFAAWRDMRQHGVDIVAVYHSHPTSPPEPSRTDLERSYYGECAVYLIVSLKVETPEVRAWWLSESGARVAEWEVMEDEPEQTSPKRL